MSSSLTEPLLRQPSKSSQDDPNPANTFAAAKKIDSNNLDLHFSGGLLGGAGSNELDEIVGSFLRQGSMVAFVVWVLLLWTAFRYAPKESFERLEGAEKHANVTVFCLLVYTNLSRLLRMVIRDRSFVFVHSGVMVGCITVQTIAMASLSLMIFFPTPVVVDPVTGIRSHLVRWCEWTAAAFLMTFLTESVDMPISTKKLPHGEKKLPEQRYFSVVAWLHGLAIGLSTAGGAISAFCQTLTQWWLVIGISWILFCSLFVRLYQRHQRLKNMSPGSSIEEKEDYERARYSFKTIAICTAAWTGLAASWSLVAILAPNAEPGTFFANPALVLITESFFEAISKVWYADLLFEVHNIVFDDATRTMRRLEELRSLMSAVWDHSSDILIWGSRAGIDGALINGIVSPRGVEFLSTSKASGLSTMLLEIDPKTHTYHSFIVDLSSPITRNSAISLRKSTLQSQDKGIDFLVADREQNISVVAKLLCEAHGSTEQFEKTVMRELVGRDDSHSIHQCETKIRKLATDSSLIVMRDITERCHRFETEKKLIAEQTARRKDFEANRFTRHEVKNGLLAAIGLMDSIREQNENGTSTATTTALYTLQPTPKVVATGGLDIVEDNAIDSPSRIEADVATETVAFSSEDSFSDLGDSYGELDNTLRDILDTVTDHAMSLDVINEEYELRLERVIVPDLFASIRRQVKRDPKRERFPIVCSPLAFPVLGLDPRLLRYIYQNALSNACRYGKPDGTIDTKLTYDENAQEFRMEVVNEPGLRHAFLLSLTKEEISRKVFSQGSRLSSDDSEVAVSNSTGDGAWIMKKCSQIMKGNIELCFEKDHTVFTFSCPAKRIGFRRSESCSTESHELTRLPLTTWGIVIDDSGIQRKLMDRFFKLAGIQKHRRVVLGETSGEIYNFCDRVRDILLSNPDDKVILIADENLDVVDGVAHHTTISGSLCIKEMLESLEPPDECRLLALVRSANDSSAEIATYTARAHGFLLKAPIEKNGVLSVIQPWWTERFGGSGNDDSDAQRKTPYQSTGSISDSEAYDDMSGDIVHAIEVIGALCKAGSHGSLRNRWAAIREKLHALMGDLKSTVVGRGDGLNSLLRDIQALRREDCPEDLPERWASLEKQVYAVIKSSTI